MNSKAGFSTLRNSRKLKTEVPPEGSQKLCIGEQPAVTSEHPKIGPKEAASPQRAGTWVTLPSLRTPPRLPTQVQSDSAIPSLCTRPTALKKPVFQDSWETNP